MEGSWQQEARLYPEGPIPTNAFFGGSVAVFGDVALISTHKSQAYLFRHSGGRWQQTLSLVSQDSTVGWGESVALDGASALIGAYGNYGSVHPGKVHIFSLADLLALSEDRCCL